MITESKGIGIYDAKLHVDACHMTKIGKLRKFKMADGRQFENVLFSISTANHPISLTFSL